MNHLQLIAGFAIMQLGYSESEAVIICAHFCPKWEAFIKMCNPDAESTAKKLHSMGEQAIQISAITKLDLVYLLKKLRIKVDLPTDQLAEGKMWLVVMCEKEPLWLQIFPKFDPSSLS